jgi:type II secretory pathway pseudopilin PulG
MENVRMSKNGFSLVELAITITINGLFLSSALLVYKEFVDWNRKQKIKQDLEEIVSRISGYATENGFLTDKKDYEKSFLKRDPYGQEYIYIFSSLLTKEFLEKKGINLCNISYSSLKLKENGHFIDNVAFLVLSKGENHITNIKCGTSVLKSSNPCNDTVTLEPQLYASWVTLEKLKLKYGCPSGIEILPQVLPVGTKGEPYSASILIDGGLPPYKVNVKGELPPGINYELRENKVYLSGKPERGGTFYFSVCVEDSNVKPQNKCKVYSIVVNYY